MRAIDLTVNGHFRTGKWRRACNAQHDCVEVQATVRSVGVRDSKSPDGTLLAFEWRSWNGFLAHLSA